ncbi:DUF2264 domain-containing protein (plasmid) [Bacillus sp. F19]|nr:DUF2264 domain-containing protein [Bacillus sp. F19]
MTNALQELHSNPLKTKQDVQRILLTLIKPFEKHYSSGHTRIHLGETGAVHSREIAGMEAFIRPLLGIVPYLAGGGEPPNSLSGILRGIANGTDPNHCEYWGDPKDYDQRVAEMPIIALALAYLSKKELKELSEGDKQNIYRWLYKANQVKVVNNNWNFFKVVINLSLKESGFPFDQNVMEKSLENIEEFYLGDGWYSDGLTEQKDFYVPFAIHFYSLIYAKFMEKSDPQRTLLFKERALQFSKDFIYWFSEDGSTFPFGRSMTYRFAQGAFWSALAFAEIEEFNWGMLKGMILRNLRWWFERPIFTRDGLLSIGYGYPNLAMAENYNAPGSPYWAFKIFLILALPDDHPFWTSQEEKMPDLNEKSVQKHPGMIICRDSKHKHVFALTSGQYADFEPHHSAEKYSKFAYSNVYGFNISKGAYGITNTALDSMLLLSENDDNYRMRRKCEKAEIYEDVLFSVWKPWRDVWISTWLIPVSHWHVRVHHISTRRILNSMEGGFAIPNDEIEIFKDKNSLYVNTQLGASGVLSLYGDRKPIEKHGQPNANLIDPRITLIPTLTGNITSGEATLSMAVLANPDNALFDHYWVRPPKFIETNDHFYIHNAEDDLVYKIGKKELGLCHNL